MPIEIKVPRLGWSMDEGTFGEWLKKEGDVVNAGDMIFVLEGDKAAQEIESFDAGVLHIPTDAPRPGDTVEVGKLLGYLLAQGESATSQRQPVPATEAPSTLATASPVSASKPNSTGDVRHKATPRAHRKARELGVDWSHLRGTGRDGRVRERDIVAVAPRAGSTAAADDQAGVSGTQRPASVIRRTIAQRMMAGVHQTARVTLTTKVDAAQLVAFRQRLRSERPDGVVPGYLDILVSLAAAALSECAELNACWRDDGVFIHDQVNIAIAVDWEHGLVAPVLNNVAALSLDEIARRSRTLVEQARAGQCTASQLQGGTFTITNLGMFDIDFFTPIINLPQSAVLGIGRIAAEPVVRDDRVVAGKTLSLSLTFDHRVIDGAPAARWLQRLSKRIERVGVDS